eukprot:SAG11_NODE_127_length_15677_cov_10.890872_1_plen_228_part_00
MSLREDGRCRSCSIGFGILPRREALVVVAEKNFLATSAPFHDAPDRFVGLAPNSLNYRRQDANIAHIHTLDAVIAHVDKRLRARANARALVASELEGLILRARANFCHCVCGGGGEGGKCCCAACAACLLCCCCCCCCCSHSVLVAENQRGRYFTYYSTALYRYSAAKNTGTMYGTVIFVRYLYGIVFLYGRTRFTDNLENFGEVLEPSVPPLLRSVMLYGYKPHLH